MRWEKWMSKVLWAQFTCSSALNRGFKLFKLFNFSFIYSNKYIKIVSRWIKGESLPVETWWCGSLLQKSATRRGWWPKKSLVTRTVFFPPVFRQAPPARRQFPLWLVSFSGVWTFSQSERGGGATGGKARPLKAGVRSLFLFLTLAYCDVDLFYLFGVIYLPTHTHLFS